PGSVGVDYVATFNNTNGVNNQNLQQELINTFNYTNNGTFLGGSDLQLSLETDPIKVAEEALTFQDYDECNPAQSVHIPDCGNNATCVNTNTSYDCVCDDGFIDDGSGCNIIPIMQEGRERQLSYKARGPCWHTIRSYNPTM
ncbi:Uromodulin-like 1, partial [Paramuricea clavata]